MATLTSRDLAQSTAITPTTLIHIVTTGDTSQNGDGSSYKAELSQLFWSGNCINDLYVTNIHGCSPITILGPIQSTNSSATGNTSFAFGNDVNAYNNYSFAHGYKTSATTLYSHSQGYETISSGNSSHAEGYQTITNGDHSHSEGNGTIAIGDDSHAEGNASISEGIGSHAEGFATYTKGNYSHTEGIGTYTSGAYQHATGKWNLTGDTTSGAFIVGNGTDNLNRSNLLLAANSGVTVYGNFSATTLTIYSSFTPSSTIDTTGSPGSIAWDDDNFYYKTNNGWFIVTGNTF